ncbi:hypothetical protein ABZ614_11830 [Streptomyces sp. NPDC013178]|uniref:hypothetical protein n=1 Tax=unclassified Streptomyces TaxID=2593676 RepID=UPI0033CE5F89
MVTHAGSRGAQARTAPGDQESGRPGSSRPTRGSPSVEVKDRGHALTIDHGWQEVADTALSFVRRFV